MEEITYAHVQKHGIGTNIIKVKLIDNKNQVIFEKFDGSTEVIAENIDTVSLYGVPFQPTTMVSGIDITHPIYFISLLSY